MVKTSDSFYRELEYAKCFLADYGYDIEELDKNCIRAMRGKIYVYDVWVSYKKGGFSGYTIKNWFSGKYFKGIKNIETIRTMK